MKLIYSLFILVTTCMFWGCSTNTSEEQGSDSRNQIAILNDQSAGVDPGLASALAETLQGEGFETTFLSAEEVCDPSLLSHQEYFLYAIPGATAYPDKGEEALTKYIEGKGNLLVLGTPILPGQPLLETVSPKYKMYPMHDITSMQPVDGQDFMFGKNPSLPVPELASSCFRRPTGKGFECGYSYRWIPLISALDATGLERGTAAWMLINQAPLEYGPVFADALRRLVATTPDNEAKDQLKTEGSVFAVCAINDQKALKEMTETALFGAMAKRISKGLYLSFAGAVEFSYWPGEKVELGASLINLGTEKSKVEVHVKVLSNRDSNIIFEKKKSISIKAGETLEEVFGDFSADADSEGYMVSTELLLDGLCIDIIKYEVGMLSEKEEPQNEFITVEGTQFKLHGENWYPIGANYWPRSAIATEQIDYLYHWLTPGFYDPDQIEDDLQRCQDNGFNFLAIRADYDTNRRSLLDFMRRCRNHDIYVYLLIQTHEVTVEPHYFEGLMMPFHFQEERVAAFIKDTRIADNPALFSWDLIWEPSNWLFQDSISMFGWIGNPNFREQWDDDWELWIDERYGSLSNAEADWNYPVPRNAEGSISSPLSIQFEEDGPWRVMLAAYRRFSGDLMNRQYNDACRTIRQLDPNHLISYRQGNLPPTDYTLVSTLKHVDFFSMEAYSFPPLENGLNKVGFVNRYLTYALEDKPFMWNEYGYGGPWGLHTRHLDGEDIEYQYEYVEMVNSEAYKNGANGIAPWWYAGGLRASEKTDFGITTPEGTLRPSGESVRKWGELYRTSPPKRPQSDQLYTIDLDAHSGGLWHITNTHGADAYEKATREGKTMGVKTSGTGTTSANTPLLAVGNTKYNGNNPPKYLNAEFNWFKIKVGEREWIEVKNGDSLDVPANTPIQAMASVGNLQEALWLSPKSYAGKAGAVYLASTDISGTELRWAIKNDTPWHGDASIGEVNLMANGISGETFIELQMTAEGRAWFGEKFRLTLLLL